MPVELRRSTVLTPPVRAALLEVYADVRAPLLHEPNYRVGAFAGRLDLHAAGAGFALVLGHDGGTVAGYAYGNTVGPGDGYWGRLAGPLPEGFADEPVFALREIGVRGRWRGTGAARRIHDGLLAGRAERRVCLMVNPLAGEGRVRRVYEGWGYRAFGVQPGSALSPELVAMVRPLG
ncbi:GNAT family N-acetyltransferase [Kitasatospora sp. NPDC057198]|uniref:GNAT family N-acetyltransferase n=1 Tax=Kitasatospora sp. NPDC057198 TaxID=3346046 RepID=UPI003633A51D